MAGLSQYKNFKGKLGCLICIFGLGVFKNFKIPLTIQLSIG